MEQQSGRHGGGIGAPIPFPHTSPSPLSPYGGSLSFIVSFNKLVKVRVSLSSASHSNTLIEAEGEGTGISSV